MLAVAQIFSGRVYALKSVRLFYTKKGRMRFVSHLDMTRFAARIIKKAGLPIWYTEGFNPHPYITFALPLSLGFESDYEIMDIRLTDDDYPIDTLCDRLNTVSPEYIRFFDAKEPQKKVGTITAAEFYIEFDDGGALAPILSDFLKRESIPCLKKTKKGGEKEIDLAPKIIKHEVSTDKNTHLLVTLPAGGGENLNPELLLGAFFEQSGSDYYCYQVNRTVVLDDQMSLLK